MGDDLEAVYGITRRLRVRQRTRIDIRCGANTLPFRNRTTCSTRRLIAIEAANRSTVSVIVTSHDDHRFVTLREVPKTRKRLSAKVHQDDQICQEPLLLIRLWNTDLVEIDPVRFGVEGSGAVKVIVGANRSHAGGSARLSSRRQTVGIRIPELLPCGI